MRNLGLGRATTREIAQAAGLSEAALYRYFSDKSDLFLSVISERVPVLLATLQDLPGQVGKRTVRENLEEIARAALPFYEHTIPVATALFSEPELLARHQERLRSRQAGPQRTLELLASYVRGEQRLGRIRPRMDADAVASLLLGACLGRAMVRAFTGDASSADADEQFARDIVAVLLKGLAPRE